MTSIRSHLITVLLTLLLAAFAGRLLQGTAGAYALTGAAALFWLLYHLIYLAKLNRWLANPIPRRIPRGQGIWQEVFDTLLQQNKSRKKRKQKTAAALQRYNRAAEAMPNGILVLNQEGRIEWHNRLAARHLNLNPQDRHGILANLIRQPEFHHFIRQPLTESPQTLKLPVQDKARRQRTLLLTRTPFENGGQLLISQDISASEQLNATRTAFIANISHELRTPLTVINGFLETLADMPDLPVEQQQEFIALMRQEGTRMQDLLADLLTLSRLENRQHDTADYRPVDLSGLCTQAAEAARALSQEQHLIDTEIEPDITLHGVAQDLYSALSNIAFNAVRYTPQGGRIHIILKKQTRADGLPEAYFAVTDTGPGIAAEHLPRLTERFYRVDPARNRQSGGTGLGLAITKHALADHHAVLEISSTVGKGSTFSTHLPLVQKNLDASSSA